MKEYYILMIGSVFYDGLYSGAVSTSDKENAKRFYSKDEIEKELTAYDWIKMEIEDIYKTIEIIDMMEFK